MHKDAAGQDLDLGDVVYFIQKPWTGESVLTRAVVVAFTPKNTTVEVANGDRRSVKSTRLVKVGS